jgi:fumarate hydratase class II
MSDAANAEPTRVERDSMGPIDVPAHRYWGAQTQRSLHHFTVAGEVMPLAIVHALAMVKAAAARANAELGVLDHEVAALIESAAGEVASGVLDDEFPLAVFQTGSGTQTNMNVNEVVANRAIELAGSELGSKQPVHPNDHVNASQSSNDVFPTAANVAVALALRDRLLPSLRALRDALVERSERWADVVKIGRTHLQDAVPLTVGQEWSGYAAQLTAGIDAVEHAMMVVLELAIGGTAVGTGLNAPEGFGPAVAAELSERTGLAFAQAPNLFAALAGAEALVAVSGALRQCATSLFKIGNDLRWLGSGPRAGLGELVLPANEPGSSIMPGKVNPTQCEALLMACVQVMGNDTTVAIAASQGNFELNVMRPVIAANVLRSIELLAATTTDVRVFLVDGVELNQSRIDELLGRSLMLVTALSPAIGYDAAAAIAHDAHERGVSLRDAALASGLISADDFDRIVDPSTMT